MAAAIEARGFFSGMKLATRFTLVLAAVLAFFCVLAVLLVNWQTGLVKAQLLNEVAQVMQSSQDAAVSRGRVSGLISDTMDGVAFKISLLMLVVAMGVVVTVYVQFVIMIRRRLTNQPARAQRRHRGGPGG
ncbi:hypothetical protein [Thioalkalivibrio sulfidiphilus]|uniref:hypothetical protein n=1 Tax=Thioalkalivibrio sulfidiphilus TaxID=1033854 RepID=UPI003BB1E2F8